MDFITNKQMYNDALKLFHIEIRQVKKGHLIFVTDGNGNPIRHPIMLSDFEERPRFYQTKEMSENVGLVDHNFNKTTIPKENHNGSKMLIGLLRLIPNYSDKNSYRNKKQLLRRKIKGLRRF